MGLPPFAQHGTTVQFDAVRPVITTTVDLQDVVDNIKINNNASQEKDTSNPRQQQLKRRRILKK